MEYYYSYCPICNSDLKEEFNDEYKAYDVRAQFCSNNCFSLRTANHKFDAPGVKFYVYHIKIFDSLNIRYSSRDGEHHIHSCRSEISEVIEHWRKNDRYLMKILEGGEW